MEHSESEDVKTHFSDGNSKQTEGLLSHPCANYFQEVVKLEKLFLQQLF